MMLASSTVAAFSKSILRCARPTNNRLVLCSLFSSTTTNRDDRWTVKFDAVKSFVDEHGHGITDDVPLNQWLRKQRYLYQNDLSQLTDERRERIESLGISLRFYEDLWEEHYAKLKVYWVQHGHSNVSLTDDGRLSSWVQRQRKLFRHVIPGELSEERIQKLSELEFCFDIHEKSWMDKFVELEEYKAYHGDCIVPLDWPSNPSLGIWVDMQRQHYSKRTKGSWHSMTDERVELLEKVGFVWNARDARWQSQFEELKENAIVNGFGKTPSKLPKISNWLSNQRVLYRQYQDGKKVSLTPDRLEKLRSIGFCL